MKTNTKLAYAWEQDDIGFPQRIAGSVRSGLGVALAVIGLTIASPGANAATSVSTTDEDFILAAAQGGMTEVKLGELAVKNGVREDVKTFGQRMIKDHTAINADLKALAGLKGITLADSLDPKHQAMVDKMEALAGIKFDDAYIAGMIKDHKMDAKEFKTEAAETKDAEIKSFVDKSISVVEGHLSQVTAMKKVPAAGVDPKL